MDGDVDDRDVMKTWEREDVVRNHGRLSYTHPAAPARHRAGWARATHRFDLIFLEAALPETCISI